MWHPLHNVACAGNEYVPLHWCARHAVPTSWLGLKTSNIPSCHAIFQTLYCFWVCMNVVPLVQGTWPEHVRNLQNMHEGLFSPGMARTARIEILQDYPYVDNVCINNRRPRNPRNGSLLEVPRARRGGNLRVLSWRSLTNCMLHSCMPRGCYISSARCCCIALSEARDPIYFCCVQDVL
jgi:hypothetical protein